MTNQKVDGSIIVDSISTLNLNMNSSVLEGSIDNENQAKNITLKLSSDSVISLTNDTYLDSLDNEDSTNSNIYANGKYKLYVGGNEVTINQDNYSDDIITISPNNESKKITLTSNFLYIVIGGCTLVVAIIFSVILIKRKR